LTLTLGTQLLGFAKSVHASHGVNELSHKHFHEVGLPHSHADYDVQIFEISFGDDAFEHSNPVQDSNTMFVFALNLISFPDSLPGAVVQQLESAWDPPFLRDTPPPPKV